MNSETNLNILIRSMCPQLLPGEFAFCSGLSKETLSALNPVCTFREEEGTSAVVPLEEARKLGVPFQYPCRQITLRVHSSLEAVGFLAAVARRLAALSISVNPVSAFFHDHLFVPIDRAEEACRALIELSNGAGQTES